MRTLPANLIPCGEGMRILITLRELINWRGTEMFTIEVANELRKRGHDVALYTPRVGFPANLIHASGAWVKSQLRDIPWTPDVIHGQHHLQAMAALSFFLDVPAIYHCHGVFPWPEEAPNHVRIGKYLVTCEAMKPRLTTVNGIPADRVTVLSGFVNVKRFSNVRSPASRLVRAVVFGELGLSFHELRKLEKACRETGISLDKIGYAYGNPKERPEEFLPQFDVVFAIGRCAIEAMACGCAVIPIVPGLAGKLITPENFDDFAFSNFSPRYFASGLQISNEWLAEEISHYSPDATAKVVSTVRSEKSLDQAVNQLESIYDGVIKDYKLTPCSSREPEFAPYLEKLSATVETLIDQGEELRKLKTDLATKTDYINELQRLIIDRHDLLNPYVPKIRTTLRMIFWAAAVKGRGYLVQLLRRLESRQ
jgi:Glycosyltransferase Family 4